MRHVFCLYFANILFLGVSLDQRVLWLRSLEVPEGAENFFGAFSSPINCNKEQERACYQVLKAFQF